ncbi:MAG: hypothetical protein MJ025_02495 [Victivallaceae bacterium]|nr:hypothetical protein [Victivallaceae bacterium]
MSEERGFSYWEESLRCRDTYVRKYFTNLLECLDLPHEPTLIAAMMEDDMPGRKLDRAEDVFHGAGSDGDGKLSDWKEPEAEEMLKIPALNALDRDSNEWNLFVAAHPEHQEQGLLVSCLYGQIVLYCRDLFCRKMLREYCACAACRVLELISSLVAELHKFGDSCSGVPRMCANLHRLSDLANRRWVADK